MWVNTFLFNMYVYKFVLNSKIDPDRHRYAAFIRNRQDDDFYNFVTFYI